MNTARPPNTALCCGDVEPGSREYSTVHPQCRQRPPTGLALPLPAKLDHFVHARWMRTKRGDDSPLKAKDNATYVGILESAVPGILKLYHKLCAICHPSSESISY